MCEMTKETFEATISKKATPFRVTEVHIPEGVNIVASHHRYYMDGSKMVIGHKATSEPRFLAVQHCRFGDVGAKTEVVIFESGDFRLATDKEIRSLLEFCF